MSGGSELKGRAANALRKAGYKPCPRYWLTDEQMELVAYMARQNADDVNRIRAKALGYTPMTEEERKKREMDRAWRALKSGRLEG